MSTSRLSFDGSLKDLRPILQTIGRTTAEIFYNFYSVTFPLLLQFQTCQSTFHASQSQSQNLAEISVYLDARS